MVVPNQIKVRLLLTLDKIAFRKFYWFEMNNEEFYWGSAYKSARSENTITEIDGTEAIITIPEDFSNLPKYSGKFSYHLSGKTHYKAHIEKNISTYDNHSIWKLKSEITKPVRFYTVISKNLSFYDKTINNLTKGNFSALVLAFDSNVANKRLYFEFFLSPEGTFDVPEPLMKINRPLTDFITHTLSENLILVIRYSVLENFDNWHSDKEITLIPNKLI